MEWQDLMFNAFSILKQQGAAAWMRSAKRRIVSMAARLSDCYESFAGLDVLQHELSVGRSKGVAQIRLL